MELSFGLEQHIPINTNKNLIYTEFEHFYQNLLNLSRIKTKMRNTCEKYSEIKVPYKHRETIRNLSNNKNIVIMKQEEGRGAVIMDRNKYFDKCLTMLNSEQLVKLRSNSNRKKSSTNFTKNQTKIAKGSIPKAISNRVVTRKVLWNHKDS